MHRDTKSKLRVASKACNTPLKINLAKGVVACSYFKQNFGGRYPKVSFTSSLP